MNNTIVAGFCFLYLFSACQDPGQGPDAPEHRLAVEVSPVVTGSDATIAQVETITIQDEAAISTEATSVPVVVKEKPSLSLVLPFDQIRAGKSQKLVSILSLASSKPEFRYVLERANNKDPGTVSAEGVFTAPNQIDADSSVRITSIWLQDETVKASKIIKVVPSSQLFVSCIQSTATFPIRAEVYDIADFLERLPSFNANDSKKVLDQCMDQIDISLLEGTNLFPNMPTVNQSFALRIKTAIAVPVNGLYKFRLNSDDGSRLFLDKSLLIDSSERHAALAVDASKNLIAGNHELALDYYEGGGGVVLELAWQVPGSAEFVPIPLSAFK